MKTILPALILVSLAAACSVTGVRSDSRTTTSNASAETPAAANGATGKGRDASTKRAALERELPIAREKLVRARANVEAETASGTGLVAKAAAQLALSEAELKTFDERTSPTRLARAKLDLRGGRDGHEEAVEELAQLEMMYKDHELADMTKEIVIRRARRRLEMTKERLALQEGDVKTLEERTLPQERAKLVLDVEEKRREVERARRGAESGLHEKRIALMSAESEVARVEGELAALAKEGS